ncbi:hypothetical protein [Streptomyces uncialis]|uniref:hypothetical protein n=1 Tax=Streptomyces uncialis TaxID=1048205 RepID=UPI0022573763|nr:hypothetical protein [Streptomyces uncialis]MCX4663375.1 hypothetical protein [Streptomyces uncialis]
MTAQTIETTAERVILATYRTEQDANKIMHQLARVLVRCGVTARYGVSAGRSSGSHMRAVERST